MNPITDKEFQNYIDHGFVYELRLSNIAHKIIKQIKLSDRETEIFAGKTKEINEYIIKIKNHDS